MIYLVDQNRLLSIFNVTKFDALQNAISTIAPSMCEYYLNDLINICESNIYLNKSNIQQIINLDSYNIYIDYDLQTYIESIKSDDIQTESLW